MQLPISLCTFNPLSAQNLGLLGDYVGGVFGTAISALALVVVFFTWLATRGGERRSRTYQVFTEMMKTHEEIVTSLRLGQLAGREAFSDILSEFHCAYRVVAANAASSPNGALSVDARIDIAYTFTFFGAQLVAIPPLQQYGEAFIKQISGQLSAEKTKNPKAADWFGGHQNRLSQYFRNLYGAYRFIDQSRLPKRDKLALGKVLRTKLSNYEQAVLALNAISNLGRTWETSGLLDRHAPIKNIPEKFFTFDPSFSVHQRFRNIEYEWEERSTDRYRVWIFRLGRLGLSLQRHAH